MKKYLFLGMCAILVGCSTTGSLKKGSEISPSGLISIMSNKDITWYGEKEESSSVLGYLINKKADEITGENAINLLSNAEKTLRDALSKNDVEVIDPFVIINSEIYLSAKEDILLKASGFVVPDGYRYLTNKDSGLVKKICHSTGIKSCLYIDFQFQKKKFSGMQKNAVARAYVTMNAVLLDSNGKIIFQNSYNASSKETFAIVGGIYNPDSLMSLFPDVINQVCEKFALELKK
ncbi:MAG: hypothetical protein RBT69_05530 [Spirochaetia bacterium]|jgi:hypothetical protein|nr:hypothetical protein [Spirochaetia bacterium]